MLTREMAKKSFILRSVVLITLIVAALAWNFEKKSKSAVVTIASQPRAIEPFVPPDSAAKMALGRSQPVGTPPSVTNSGSSAVESFGSAKDLWAYARRAEARGRIDDVFEAYSATQACLGFMATRDNLAVFVGGGHSLVQGPLTPERQLAVSELTARCAGFQKAGQFETRAFAAKLRTRLASEDGGAYSIDFSKNVSPAQITRLLSAGAPDAVATALPLVLEPWQRSLGIPDNDPREDELAMALVLASCDLGSVCSATGHNALSNCAFANKCGQETFQGWESRYTEEQIARILTYQQQVVAAVHHHRWDILGLSNKH
jgi:hypothetical protein